MNKFKNALGVLLLIVMGLLPFAGMEYYHWRWDGVVGDYAAGCIMGTMLLMVVAGVMETVPWWDCAIIHITPIDDIEEHEEEGQKCKCGPVVTLLPDGNIMVVHNSFDRREMFEANPEMN